MVSSSGITGYHDEPKIQPPGVVTGRYGTLGEVFFLEEPFWPLNTTLYVSDFHGNNPRFVAYFLCCQDLGARDGAAAVPGINRNVLHRLPAKRPPVPIQRKIATILSAYDDLIDNNNRRIEVLEEMVQRIYAEWFVDFRFSGHHDVPLEDSELGPIPDSWEVCRTADLIAAGSLVIGDGYRAKNSEFRSEGWPFVRIRNLGDDLDLGDVERLPFEGLPRFKDKLSRPGDCVVSTKGTVGRIIHISDRTPSFVYSPQLSYWRLLDDAIAPAYLRAWLQGPEFERQCAHVKGGTDMADYVNLKDQRRMLIALPPRELQMRFAGAVDPLYRSSELLRSSRNNLRSTRDLLLPRLIAGEIDITDLDIVVPDLAA